MTEQESSGPQSTDPFVVALQGWHKAKEAATRYNRNLLQYGATVAAALGIEAGSGGIIAIANSLPKTAEESGNTLPTWALYSSLSWR